MNLIRRKFLRAMAGADWSNGQRRRYARQFEVSVEHLGDRWLLAQPQPRHSTHVPASIPASAATFRQWRTG